ncbi:Rho GTPase activation protein [Phascolomyces articulosus]|uniref:Rho GTPase activation protein n=1 Tax=Phascolomyces articulosus TaxID=60185 RepID=A0AAD5K7W5_9FUNG|nr:Rho GTPase activation protein [Phascolomyces articulosus]
MATSFEIPGVFNNAQIERIRSWWKKVNPKGQNFKDMGVPVTEKGVFGIPLSESIKYAHSSISYIDDRTGKQCFGAIPTVIAKCGSFLKEEALSSKGIFRLCGNVKRVGLLQTIFDTPDEEYGAKLDWRGYTTYDAASILRRFLIYLPEPVITHDYYKLFRETIDMTFESQDLKVNAYQKLIEQLPLPNQYLLLYLLDLLGVFAMHTETTLMDIPSLAVIFTPGILCHPDDKMNPASYKVSQRVIHFLIEHQSQFLMPEVPETTEDNQARRASSTDGTKTGIIGTDTSKDQQEQRRKTEPQIMRNPSLYSNISTNTVLPSPCEDLFNPSVVNRRKNALLARGLRRSKTAPIRRRRYDSPQVVHVNRYPSQGANAHTKWLQRQQENNSNRSSLLAH